MKNVCVRECVIVRVERLARETFRLCDRRNVVFRLVFYRCALTCILLANLWVQQNKKVRVFYFMLKLDVRLNNVIYVWTKPVIVISC
jgi:hypothetical protein